MADNSLRLTHPNGKPFWLVYGIRRTSDGAMIYIGSTFQPLWVRWCGHGHQAASGHDLGPLQRAIRDNGLFAFEIEALACCSSKSNAACIEASLITDFGTLHPRGLNSKAAARGRESSAEYRANHKTAIRAALLTLSPDARARRLAGVRRGWQDPEKKVARLARLRTVALEGNKKSWRNAIQRPARLAQLQAASRRPRGKRIKDRRQPDLF